MATIDPHRGRHLAFYGYSVLVSNNDGTLTDPAVHGLFDYDTRVLSRYRITVDGCTPTCDTSASVSHDYWAAHLTVSPPGHGAGGGHLPQDVIAIELRRRVGGGMAERIRVRNHSMAPVAVTLRLELDADFADIMEVTAGRQHGGRTRASWNPSDATLTFDHRATRDDRVFHRALRIRVTKADSTPSRGGLRALTFPLSLAARGEWVAILAYESLVDDRWRIPDVAGLDDSSTRDLERAQWHDGRARVHAPHSVFTRSFTTAADDLYALRAREFDVAADAWWVNGGVPTYTGLFGRDALTAAWQASLLGPEMLRGTVARMAATQASSDSAWHDREPGKMVHEMRRGPLSELDIIPQQAYYGTQSASSMFIVALSEYWHWTGDTSALAHYRESALRVLEWAQRFGDRDGDGFLEYDTRSARGLKNQGWKDSNEAIRYPDGRDVPNPIATVEEQAFYILALQRMGGILAVLGEQERSAEFTARASDLQRRWHQAFWMPDKGFYAMALDPDKRPVESIASNPGHALAAGIVPPEHARACADRLMAADLFSGYGVRTLSRDHPSYNPLAYHLGTVWPVENATFALGFMRYGLTDHLQRLVNGLYDAATHFQDFRLPEAIGGHAREETPVPTVYPTSNSPQAWSASAIVMLVQGLLGLYAFAPAHVLAVVRPQLPEWLPWVVVKNVRVGSAHASLRFERNRDGTTSCEVIEKAGPLTVVAAPPPQDAAGHGETWHETVARILIDHAPGRLATALRLDVGHVS
jgi:glycogen debranching enzyme